MSEIASDFPLLGEVAACLQEEDWLLVGGLMVHLHCARVGVAYARPTADVDLVVNPASGSNLESVARRLQACGFEPIRPLRADGFLHRFSRPLRGGTSFVVDVMAPDSALSPQRWRGYRVVHAPGTKSALGLDSSGKPKEIVSVDLGGGLTADIPNVWSALAMKGHNLRLPDMNRERHVEDAIALFACAHRSSPKRPLTKSERSGLNNLLSSSYFEDVTHWTPLASAHWAEAYAEMSRIRPEGELRIPPVLRQQLTEGST